MSARVFLAAVVTAALFTGPAAAADVTTWTDSTGGFTVEAEFVRLSGETVILKQAGGGELEIPLDKLSEADQKRAKDLAAAASSPFKSRPSSPFKSRADSGGKMDETPKADDPPPARSSGPRDLALRGEGRALTPPDEVEAGWSIEPDGVETGVGLPKAGLRFQTGKTIHDRVRNVVIDRGAGKAVVDVAIHKFTDPAEGTNLIVVDLADGEAMKPVRVDGNQEAKSLTVNGTRLCCVKTAFGFGKSGELTCFEVGPRSVDPLWSISPFMDRKSGPEKDVAYGAALSDDLAMVVNSRGLTVFFDPNTGETEATAELGDWEAIPTLSAGGKYLVLTGELQTAVYDAATLEPLAALKMPAGMNPVTAKFSTDGTRLMCVGRQRLAVFDAATGDLLGETLHGSNLRSIGDGLAHAGGTYYFVGGRLVDIDSHVPVWDYVGVEGVTDFAGDTVFFYDRFPGQTGASLVVAGELPHKAPREALQDALKDPNLFALKPGDTVEVDLKAVSTKTGVDEARRLIEDWAAGAGVKIGPSDKKLVGTMRQGEEQTREYRSIGFGRGGSETVRYRPQVATMRLMVGGQEAWKSEQTSGGPSFMLNMKDGETAQQAVNRMGQPDARMLGRMTPPAYVLGGKYGNSLGQSMLTGRGLTDSRNGG